MSVTARQLSKSGARGKELDNIIREQLQIIDDKLLRADRTWGRNVVAHELPTMIGLPGLEKKDAQRLVYSAILSSLDKRGFETRLLLEQDRSAVYIAWMTDLDIEEVEAMNALIRAKRIARNDLETFIKRGAAPAPRTATAARQGRGDPVRPMVVNEADRVMQPRGGLGAADAGRDEVRAAPAAASTAETEILKAAQ